MPVRDLRDPATLGRKYLHLRSGGMCIEDAVHVGAQDYNRGESTVQSTVAEYRSKMVEQAAQGDASARDVCDRNAWAYEVMGDDSVPVHAPVNGSQDLANLAGLEVRACRKARLHDPHAWSVVGQPGSRTSVALYACPGLVAEDEI